jgi:hypothetical protein
VNVAGDVLLCSECCGICVVRRNWEGERQACVQNLVNVNKSDLVK